MKNVIAVVTILFIFSSLSYAVPQGVDLASMNGWDIVIAEDAIASEIYAAKEFQSHFELAGGVKLPIVKAIDRPDHHVFIGPGKLMRCSALGFDVNEFDDEDLRIVVRDNNIVIAGGRPRGTLYGVYTFLEDYLGIRFLTAEHTHVPRIGKWHMIGPVDRFYHPPFDFRWSAYPEVGQNPVFAARLRVNTVPRDPNLGGCTKVNLVTHTFFRQVPVKEYGKEHPEYYSMIDGKRHVEFKGKGVYYNQLCLTNPDVLRIVTEAVMAKLKANPDVGSISAGQNDGNLYCQCPKCAAIDQREGSGAGSLITFINAIADKVAEKYPGVLVGTFAYNYTQKPPKSLKPRPNVLIQLCNRSCMLHPIDDPDCPANAEFCRMLSGWGKICEHVYLWTYNNNTFNYLLPWPNLRVIGPNINYFAANNVKGLFMCAGGMSSEFSELRNYMMANLLWDPSRNGQQLMDEFLDLHYGQAAGPIRRFINMVHDHVVARYPHLDMSYKTAAEFGIDESIAQAGLDAFDEALGLAENQTIRERVEKASICAYRAAVEPVLSYPYNWKKINKAELDPVLVERVKPLAKRLFELCDKYDVDRAGMYTKIEDYRDRLKKLIDF